MVIVGLAVAALMVLAGCGQAATTSGANSLAYIDPENLLDNQTIWGCGEQDLLDLGAIKITNEENDDAYAKDVMFLDNAGKIKYFIGDEGMAYFTYETMIIDGAYKEKYLKAYDLLLNTFNAQLQNGECGTDDALQKEGCTIEAFKNNAGKESMGYDFFFKKGDLWIFLDITINADDESGPRLRS